MRRRGIFVVLAIACAVAGCTGTRAKPAASAAEGIGSPLPAIELPLLQGGTWRSADARGAVLVIDIWATWCKPCRKGFPVLDEMARRHGDARFVAISIDEDEQTVRAFVSDVGTELPIVLDTAQWATGAPLSVARIPTVLVVDAGGVVRLRLEEPSLADYARVEQTVERLLSE